AFPKPGLEPLALPRRQDQDVVLAHGVAGLDRDAEALRFAPAFRLLLWERRTRRHQVTEAVELPPARIRIEVLHEARSGIGVQMLEQRSFRDVDLIAREDGGDGND